MCADLGLWRPAQAGVARPSRVSSTRTTFARRFSAASSLPARWRSRACWNNPSRIAYAAAGDPLDITDDHSWERCIESTIAELGGLDIVVNNAGVEITQLVIDLDPDDIRKMLEVNILGTALGIKHAFRAMRPGGPAGRGGAVVNIASVAATIAFPGIAVYSATKSAVDRLTRVAAMESGKLGYAVRVNCVYPGLVPTEMGNQLAQDMVTLGLFPSVEECVGAVIGLTPHGRLGEVADMADAVVFLASDASRFITGAGLPVDGGMGM